MVWVEVVEHYLHHDFLEPFVVDVTEGFVHHIKHPTAVRVKFYCRVAIQPICTASGSKLEPDHLCFNRAIGELAVLEHAGIGIDDGGAFALVLFIKPLKEDEADSKARRAIYDQSEWLTGIIRTQTYLVNHNFSYIIVFFF